MNIYRKNSNNDLKLSAQDKKIVSDYMKEFLELKEQLELMDTNMRLQHTIEPSSCKSYFEIVDKLDMLKMYIMHYTMNTEKEC